MKVIASQNFKLTGRGIASFIKHNENGLPPDTILFSSNRNIAWKVEHRQLWTHALHLHKRFPSEKESIGHMRFEFTDENMDPIKRIIEFENSVGVTVMQLHSVEANVNPVNEASKKLLEKIGFVQEAYFRENYYYDGRFIDSAVYSLLTPQR